MSKIIYEPHPVSEGRKAKLQAEGYKILDAIFAPAGTPIHKEMDMAPEAPEHDVALEAAAAAAAALEAEAAEAEAEQDVEDSPAKRGRPKKG